ncbi:hypothetical protein J2810_003337 [Chryseobacterium rhizosphaerae]|uniref:T9SS type A sorting domain-containing protein n=1 Tax=Chryseobacterium rhizosphaerae TaxID=395937 RepID=UPI00286346DB|nr:T9SS type A sorting domain-containing protein [Chryseobacterium rhizosphaerae]MDR6547266.1 hypothetical protein [Chryseobacterium rhizosphaerae]
MKTHLFSGSCFTKAALLVSLLYLMSNLFSAQSSIETYATSETHTVSALCLGCSIQNPQNAIGDNLYNYSTLKIGAGLLGKVEQTLQFPAVSTKNLSIIIGTGSNELSVSLLNGATIETMNGNISNGDSRPIDNNILEIGTLPNEGTIKFRPTQPYDRVKISLNAGILSLNRELRIYYAYQSAFVTSCAAILPGDPYLYYPFDGSIQELIRNMDLTLPNPPNMFLDSLICGKALAIPPLEILKHQPFQMSYEKTISFWASTADNLALGIFDTVIKITLDSIKITALGPRYQVSKRVPAHSSTNLHHYSITVLPTFRTPIEKTLCEQQGGTSDGCSIPTKETISIYIDGVIWSSFPLIIQPDVSIPDSNNKMIWLSALNSTIIDELLVYDEVLPDEVLKKLPCAYNLPQNCPSGNPTPLVSTMKTTPAENILTLSPNPTTGRITLDGNIPITGAEIFVNNTFGKEVFREKLNSKTVDLPATLPEGVYFMTLQTQDGKVYTHKIILTK